MSVRADIIHEMMTGDEDYAFVDFLRTLHRATEGAETMNDALNAWLRFKQRSHDVHLRHGIDACVYYHIYRVARDQGHVENANNLMERMVASWDLAAENDFNSIVDVDRILLSDI